MKTTTPWRSVIFATDFSEACRDACDAAILLTSVFDAELVLLHVCEVPAYAYTAFPYAPLDLIAPVEATATKLLDELVSVVRERMPRAVPLLKTGVAWEQILATAAERRDVMLVLGTHGRRGIAHALFGSVAEKVVRLAACPVLTVRPR